MQRVSTILLGIFAVIVLAGAVAVIKDKGSYSGSSATTSVSSGAVPSTPTSSARTSPAPSSPAPSSPAPSSPAPTTSSSTARAEPVVAFLGDDWTSGVGASARSRRFSSLLAARLHVVQRNLGRRGSGYAAGADYVSRVADVVAAHPDVVVVTGGRNDVVAGVGGTAAANAAGLFDALHRMLPHATIVAVAPMWGDSDAPPGLTALATAVQAAVTADGGTYLDLPDPIHGHPGDMADGSDPDDDGYAAIADALAPRLAALLPR